jgi:hypothetical protein
MPDAAPVTAMVRIPRSFRAARLQRHPAEKAASAPP